MPRIKKKDIYPLQDPVNPDDYWIGSEGESSNTPGKTKNFSASGVLAYVQENIGVPEGSQDNIGRYINISYNGDNTFDSIANAINASPTFTVSVYDDMWFRVVNTKVGSIRAGLFRMINTGKGVYGMGGAIEIEASDLQFVCSVQVQVDDFLGLVGTEQVNYGDLTGTTVEEWLNTNTPNLAIQSQENGYTIFYGTIDGGERQYLWIGDGGSYGSTNPTATSNDFQLLAGVGGTLPTSPVPNLQQVTDQGYLTNKPLISALANLHSTMNAGIVSAANTSTGRQTEMSPTQYSFSQGANQLTLISATLSAGIKTQTLQNKTGTIALVEPEFYGFINQTGTNDPVLTAVKNTFSSPITCTRTGVGTYFIQCADWTVWQRIQTIPDQKLFVSSIGTGGVSIISFQQTDTPSVGINVVTGRFNSVSGAPATPSDLGNYGLIISIKYHE